MVEAVGEAQPSGRRGSPEQPEHVMVCGEDVTDHSSNARSQRQPCQQSQQKPAQAHPLKLIVHRQRNFGDRRIIQTNVAAATNNPLARRTRQPTDNAAFALRIDHQQRVDLRAGKVMEGSQETMPEGLGGSGLDRGGNQRFVLRCQVTDDNLPAVWQSVIAEQEGLVHTWNMP